MLAIHCFWPSLCDNPLLFRLFLLPFFSPQIDPILLPLFNFVHPLSLPSVFSSLQFCFLDFFGFEQIAVGEHFDIGKRILKFTCHLKHLDSRIVTVFISSPMKSSYIVNGMANY